MGVRNDADADDDEASWDDSCVVQHHFVNIAIYRLHVHFSDRSTALKSVNDAEVEAEIG